MKKCSHCGKEIKIPLFKNVDYQGFLFCDDCLKYCEKRDY